MRVVVDLLCHCIVTAVCTRILIRTYALKSLSRHFSPPRLISFSFYFLEKPRHSPSFRTAKLGLFGSTSVPGNWYVVPKPRLSPSPSFRAAKLRRYKTLSLAALGPPNIVASRLSHSPSYRTAKLRLYKTSSLAVLSDRQT